MVLDVRISPEMPDYLAFKRKRTPLLTGAALRFRAAVGAGETA
jgi:hypothetical protein